MAQTAILKNNSSSRTRKQNEEINTLIEQLNVAGEQITLRLDNINRQMEEIITDIRSARREKNEEVS